MKVIKRNGSEVDFDVSKIIVAITKANNNTDTRNKLSEEQIHEAAEYINFKCSKLSRAVSVEEIQDMVEHQIMSCGAFDVAKAYVKYRYKRELVRKANSTDERILSIIGRKHEEIIQENSNKNPMIVSTQRDYIAGEVSKDLSDRILLPADVIEADHAGILHFHDKDYFAQPITNCCLVNLEDMFQNGTVISNYKIEKPKSFYTACNISTQIIAQVASSQFGGQSITLSHLAPFVDISRKKIKNNLMQFENTFSSPEAVQKVCDKLLADEIKSGVQTLQYQIITLMTTNGQAPFVTIFMNINEVPEGQLRNDLALIIKEVLNQRYDGVKNEAGIPVTPAFPKLIYVLDENNAYEGTEYWYLTQLAIKCTAKRLVPDYISAKKMRELKDGNVFPCMGCRSFLSVYHDESDKPKFYSRFNQGVVTINLVDAACSAIENGGDLNQFWSILEERLELCHKALRCRHENLKGTPSDVAPILWQHGALARLEKGETIDKLLYGGFSTISLGYAGLWECVYELIGKKLTEPEGQKLGLEIMQKMNDFCDKWKEAENIGYSLYGTPKISRVA